MLPLSIYSALRSHYKELYSLMPMGEFLTIWMVELTTPTYLSWSETEIFRFLVSKIHRSLPPGFESLLHKIHLDKTNNITEIIKWINQLKIEEIMTNMYDYQENVTVTNAGVLLIAPFFSMLFYRVGYLNAERKDFKDENSRILAIFLIQYLFSGEQREWSERELFLNKIIVGMDTNMATPRKVELSESNIKLADDLLQTVIHMWDKMRHTSIVAFRQSFLMRAGVYTPGKIDQLSTIKVESKAFDVLLDFLPWSIHYVMAPWMKTKIKVEWRS